MARMNLRLRRDAPGVSVFWMILGIGAAIMLLIGIYLYATGGDARVETGDPPIVVGDGDEAPATTSFSEGEVATREGEAGETDDSAEAGPGDAVDVAPAEPADAAGGPAEDDADAEAERQE